MALETLIKAIDLVGWADRLDARSRLPLLLRRLIHATIDRIQRIGFPAEEGIQVPGYDGFLIVENGNAFVPDGCSVWEMGVDRDIKGKADGDYEKRRNEPLDVDPATTSFVFVTPRRWNKKADWVEEKKKDGFWRDVRAYDADDLEQWMELAPSAHIWASALLGKHPKNVEDLDAFWENWSSATQPILSPKVLTSGRDDAISEVDRWLSSNATIFTLKSDTREEAISFLAATIKQKPSEERIIWLSRIILVNDLESFTQLSVSERKLILVPRFNAGNTIERAVQGGHSVLVPFGKGESSLQTAFELPRQHIFQLKEALVELGLPEERALSLARIARLSLMAFRRKLATHPELLEPEWSRPENAREIIPALLLGQWSDVKEGDRSAIEKLANLPYKDYIAKLVRWSNESDPPVRLVGGIWILNSKEDAWGLLSRYISYDDLQRFEELTLCILGEINPSLDMPINERWSAAIHGKALSFSDNLREGITDTLAIAGARSAVTNWGHSTSPQEYVDRVVYKLFTDAGGNWKIWSSLSPVLRLLAEASPNQFLDAADKAVSGSSPTLANIFEEPESPMFYGATYPGLLSALELLAWSPEHIARSALILAALDRLDPGGRLGNRPSNSLKDIFLIWLPQTSASLEQRLRVLDMLRKREGVVAWKLMSNLLPEPHAVSMGMPSPRYRDWVPDERPSVTWGEIWTATHEIVNRMHEDVGYDGKQWKSLIESIGHLRKEDAENVILHIEHIDQKFLGLQDQVAIWAALRSLVAKHKQFSKAQWALPSEVVDRLNQIYEWLTPVDLIARYAWLFSNHVELIGDFDRDWKSREAAITKERIEAVKVVLETGGISLLIEMMEKVENPYYFGVSAGQSEVAEQNEDALLSLLNSEHNFQKLFLTGFIVMREKMLGWDWIIKKTSTPVFRSCTPEQQAEFFICLSPKTQTWKFVETFGERVGERYWMTLRPNPFEIDDLRMAIQKLLENKRPHVALDIVTMHIDKIGSVISATSTMDALEMAIRTKPEYDGEWRVFDHIDELFEAIERTGEIDESRLAYLEFALIRVLTNRGGRGPKFLNKELSLNPAFFIEVLCLAYCAEGEDKRELSEDESARAISCYELLHGWNLIPGMENNGSINSVALNDWVQKVRELSAQHKRVKVSDLAIGQVFSHSPKESDGTWPAIPIRDLMESINSDEINRGFMMGVSNNRGVTSRGLLDGGTQERELADQYKQYADAIRTNWPRTAAVLDKLTGEYLSYARHEDVRAQLEEDSW
ncbi:MAG: hypothetical protein C3F13_02895 [Anaerolineales bacterium]|nr:MAG: hypothetical protein C3F13_02895 [Anaerolineales bacterium]